MISIYMHNFSSKESIISEFGIDSSELEGAEILLAYYHVGDYGCDSSAFVLYRKDGKLWEVNASHCSCYGLSESGYSGETESQWDPEETTVEALEHRATKGSLGWVGGYDDEGYHKESLLVIEYLKNNP
jgi:hypothetical protein